MNPPQIFTGYENSNRPSPRKELQGPRPPSLKVNKDSYKIRKPPVVPHQHHHQSHQRTAADDRQPVIIYAVSPKVIHTTVSDFMTLVQRLTGNTASGGLSPAARLASIEKTSPKNSEIVVVNGDNDIMGDLLRDVEDVGGGGGGRFSGILSPAPGSLRPISPGFFSPAAGDPFNMMGFNNNSNYNNNMFVPSPSNLFSAPIVSPSSTDFLLNSFFDF